MEKNTEKPIKTNPTEQETPMYVYKPKAIRPSCLQSNFFQDKKPSDSYDDLPLLITRPKNIPPLVELDDMSSSSQQSNSILDGVPFASPLEEFPMPPPRPHRHSPLEDLVDMPPTPKTPLDYEIITHFGLTYFQLMKMFEEEIDKQYTLESLTHKL